ncbi:GerAB/ArcD/ProY family transporter [Desulfotomaculum defluvii]
MSLATRFSDKTLVEFNDIIYGPVLGKIISSLYLFYLIHLASLVLGHFGHFFKAVIYPNTPMAVILLLIIGVCCSAVRNGIEVISRSSLIFFTITLLNILLTFVLLFKDMNFQNLLPILDLPLKDFIKSAHSIAIFPFGEVIAFLMIFPFVKRTANLTKHVLIIMFIAGISISLISIRNITTLGPLAEIESFRAYSSVRLIEIADVITRMEILLAINFLLVGVVKIFVLFYGGALGLAQFFKLKKYPPLVYPLGAIITLMGLVNFNSYLESLSFASDVFPYYSLLFQLILPLISLIVAITRGLPKKVASNQ